MNAHSMDQRCIAVAAMLGLAGCSGIQRDPPLQVWPDMRIPEEVQAAALHGLVFGHPREPPSAGRRDRSRPHG